MSYVRPTNFEDLLAEVRKMKDYLDSPPTAGDLRQTANKLRERADDWRRFEDKLQLAEAQSKGFLYGMCFAHGDWSDKSFSTRALPGTVLTPLPIMRNRVRRLVSKYRNETPITKPKEAPLTVKGEEARPKTPPPAWNLNYFEWVAQGLNGSRGPFGETDIAEAAVSHHAIQSRMDWGYTYADRGFMGHYMISPARYALQRAEKCESIADNILDASPTFAEHGMRMRHTQVLFEQMETGEADGWLSSEQKDQVLAVIVEILAHPNYTLLGEDLSEDFLLSTCPTPPTINREWLTKLKEVLWKTPRFRRDMERDGITNGLKTPTAPE